MTERENQTRHELERQYSAGLEDGYRDGVQDEPSLVDQIMLIIPLVMEVQERFPRRMLRRLMRVNMGY